MIRAWCDQIRFNKPREYIPRGFRLLQKGIGIAEYDGDKWKIIYADEVAVLSIGRVLLI